MADLDPVRVIVGVDTHKHFHVAQAKDHLGRGLGELKFAAATAGYGEMLAWAAGFGQLETVGIEGPGSYGAALRRFLAAKGVVVLEVGRPSRQHRARHGKSDPVDAGAAAGAVLSGQALGVPKSADGPVEALRVLRLARASAVKAKTTALLNMRDLLITAPHEVRDPLMGISSWRLVRSCAAMAAPSSPATPEDAVRAALVSLAQRYLALEAEAKALGGQITPLVHQACPELLALPGVGSEVAAALLVALGDNPARLGSEAAIAKLCGVSPLDASSGRNQRHRLNRGGNRQANSAPHTVVVVRLRVHAPTKAYMARRLAEGRTKKEVMRCLKRYLVREIFGVVHQRFNGKDVGTTACAA